MLSQKCYITCNVVVGAYIKLQHCKWWALSKTQIKENLRAKMLASLPLLSSASVHYTKQQSTWACSGLHTQCAHRAVPNGCWLSSQPLATLSHWAHCTTSPDSLHRGAAHCLTATSRECAWRWCHESGKHRPHWTSTAPLRCSPRRRSVKSSLCTAVTLLQMTWSDTKFALHASYLPVNLITNSRLMFWRSLPPEIDCCAEVLTVHGCIPQFHYFTLQ